MTTPNVVTGTFTGTGVSASLMLERHFNISINGGSGTVQIQRSFDDGSTFRKVKEYTADIEETGIEPEGGIYYRLECTAFTSGTISYRLAQTPPT